MRFSRSKYLAYALVVLYSGISLLGYGLHLLSPADHHHHHPRAVRHVADGAHRPHGGRTHDHCSHRDHHGCETEHNSDSYGALSIATSKCCAHSHACDICLFLDQVKSQQPHMAAAVNWQPIVAAVPRLTQREHTRVVLTLYAPRGPPVLF